MEATTGSHDYKSCAICAENLSSLISSLTEKFEGNADKKGFPHCRDGHARLLKEKGFKRSLFKEAIDSTALKTIYTHQHIVNHFADSGWKKTIRDYIRYAADSFGSMPEGCGNPLFLDRCYYSIIEDVKKPHNIPEDKRKGIVNLIEAIFLSERGDVFEDIDILFKTYSRWQDTFPFALKEYFKNQKELFYNRVPFLRGGVEVNMFNGKEYALTYNSQTLLEHLCILTNTLLSEVDTYKMVKDGMIADINAHQFEIAGVTLRVQNELNLKKYTQNERAYAETIRQ